MDIWTLIRFGHLLGVAVWLGGMLFLGLVAVPAARATGDRGTSRTLITNVAKRFGAVGGAAWLLILLTGGGLMSHRDLSFADLTDSDYGKKILAKLVLLLLVGVAVVLHGMWQGPRVRRADEAGDEAELRRWQKIGAVLDAFMLLATLVALWLAASLIA